MESLQWLRVVVEDLGLLVVQDQAFLVLLIGHVPYPVDKGGLIVAEPGNQTMVPNNATVFALLILEYYL